MDFVKIKKPKIRQVKEKDTPCQNGQRVFFRPRFIFLKLILARSGRFGYDDQALSEWRLSSVGRASALQAEGQR
ncbi:hypothetical protein, partial [uncultured Allobaculum sp.]|uniref:hypothetical protein n=1 Tax=uncultured Allobaculum sp. TaxID=1187017 RepID=UPI0026ECB8CB